MKYKYVGECAAGLVEFNRPNMPDESSVVMPAGEAVEVPDWLEPKLATNNHFEKVTGGNNSNGDAETGECPDCGKTVKVKKDGYLYAHDCVDD